MGKGNTPEGKVKKAVDEVLTRFGVLYYKPVVTGFGKRQLDYICCVRGLYLVIETKAPGEVPTGRQRELCLDAYAAGGKVFIISNAEGITSLYRWLYRVTHGPTSPGADPV